MSLSEKQKTGMVVAIGVAAVLFLAIVFWPRRARASSSPVRPIGNIPAPATPANPGGGAVGTVVAPTVPVHVNPPSPDPYSPTTTPTPGAYYIPKANDGEIRICQLAGLPTTAWRKIRDHALNAWIPKVARKGQTTKQLDLDWGYDPMLGRESLGWAWKVAHTASAGKKICIVYVPKASEVGA